MRSAAHRDCHEGMGMGWGGNGVPILTGSETQTHQFVKFIHKQAHTRLPQDQVRASPYYTITLPYYIITFPYYSKFITELNNLSLTSHIWIRWY